MNLGLLSSMEILTFDQIVQAGLPPDFVGFLNQLWPLFPVGILLGVLAWLVSITVYTVLQVLNKA